LSIQSDSELDRWAFAAQRQFTESDVARAPPRARRCYRRFVRAEPGKCCRLHWGGMTINRTKTARPGRCRRPPARRLDKARWRWTGDSARHSTGSRGRSRPFLSALAARKAGHGQRLPRTFCVRYLLGNAHSRWQADAVSCLIGATFQKCQPRIVSRNGTSVAATSSPGSITSRG
jgi:hypothetical protein